MVELSAERGGDPARPGKKDALDPLVWRGERPGEPAWGSGFGAGRPGWHVECAAIASEYLGTEFDVQAGGSDLIFPHHEMSGSHARVALGPDAFARVYAHAGLVSYQGAKMSKSLGNLVFVSKLREAGVDPMAIRLAILAHHYRSEWEWTDMVLQTANQRLARWRAAVQVAGADGGEAVLAEVRDRMADDLDAPGALAAIDRWADQVRRGESVPGGGDLVRAVADALLGVSL
jgi:L-cysteine:1D-myo-inositol 2-amino-2-deoxy-alpha-D-glucopyranoside ligase